MKTRTKALAAAAVVALGALGTQALAAPPEGPGAGYHGPCHHGPGPQAMRGGPGGLGPGFGLPARLAALEVELGITAEQEAAWADYVASLEEGAEAMQAMREQSREQRRQQRDEMRQRFGALKEAAEALLPTLDEAQQAKAAEILPGLAEPPRGPRRGMGPGHGWHRQGPSGPEQEGPRD